MRVEPPGGAANIGVAAAASSFSSRESSAIFGGVISAPELNNLVSWTQPVLNPAHQPSLLIVHEPDRLSWASSEERSSTRLSTNCHVRPSSSDTYRTTPEKFELVVTGNERASLVPAISSSPFATSASLSSIPAISIARRSQLFPPS